MKRGLIVLLGLGVAGLWLALPAADDPGETPGGEAARYRLEFASSDRLLAGTGSGPGDATIHTRLQIDVEIRIDRVSADTPGETRRRFQFERCDQGRFAIGETELWADADDCAAELVGPSFLIDYSAGGQLLRVHEPVGGGELFGRIAAYVFSEISFWTPGEETEVAEANLRGVALSRYEAVAEGEWLRHRNAYESLTTAVFPGAQRTEVAGRHRLRREHGELRAFIGAETLKVYAVDGELMSAINRIELRYLGPADGDSSEPETEEFLARGLREVPENEALARRMLVRRAAGLTEAEFLDTLRRFAGGGRLPDHDRFLWRSYALLKLNPELAWDLVPVFKDGNSTARTLVLDLLSQVGHPEAQEVILELLQGDEARDDPRAVELHQRLSFVEDPEPATVKYAEDRYLDARQETDDAWRFASAYTIGAVARRADTESADRLRQMLGTDLAAESDPVAIRHLVVALGAAQHEDDAGQIAGYADHDDPDVRAAVATTLDAPQTETAHAALFDLIADGDRLTQHQAIRSLRRHALGDDDFETISNRVSEGVIYQANFRALTELAKGFRSRAREGSDHLLRALIDHGIEDSQVNAAAHLLLQQRGEQRHP